jgi:hypothetical protein
VVAGDASACAGTITDLTTGAISSTRGAPKLLHEADAVVDRAEGNRNEHGDNEAVEEVAERRVADQVGFLQSGKPRRLRGEASRTGSEGPGGGVRRNSPSGQSTPIAGLSSRRLGAEEVGQLRDVDGDPLRLIPRHQMRRRFAVPTHRRNRHTPARARSRPGRCTRSGLAWCPGHRWTREAGGGG